MQIVQKRSHVEIFQKSKQKEDEDQLGVTLL